MGIYLVHVFVHFLEGASLVLLTCENKCSQTFLNVTLMKATLTNSLKIIIESQTAFFPKRLSHIDELQHTERAFL